MVVTALVGVAAAMPAVLEEVRWTPAEVVDGVALAAGDTRWRMRCPDAQRPRRVARLDAARLEGPFSDPAVREDGWWHFAPGPSVDQWEVGDCEVHVVVVARTARGFDRLEHESPEVVWPSRARSAFGDTATAWLAEGGIDAYRALRPPVLRGPGTVVLPPGPVRGPARLLVVATGEGPTCVEVAGLRSCRLADPEARWWLTLPEGTHDLQLSGAVQGEVHRSWPAEADAPVRATVWPRCDAARDCAERWSPVPPDEPSPSAHRLEPARGVERVAWWPAGHPALEEATWLEQGSVHLLAVGGDAPCTLQLDGQSLVLHAPPGRPVRSRVVWTSDRRPSPPAEATCPVWVRAESERDAWDARVLRTYHRVEPDRPLGFVLDPTRPAALWVLGGTSALQLRVGSEVWRLLPGPTTERTFEGDAVAPPVRVPLPPGPLQVRAPSGAFVRVLQPGDAPPEDLAATLSARERAPAVDLRALQAASLAVFGSTGAARAVALRARARLCEAAGLVDDAAADRRRAAVLDPRPEEPLSDRWPAVARALEGEERWVPVDERWLSVAAVPMRPEDPLQATHLQLPAAERVRLMLRAVLDRQIPTAAERVEAYAALSEVGPAAVQAPSLALVRGLSSWERVQSVQGARSALRPTPPSTSSATALAWRDALFFERWPVDETVSLGPGDELRLPAGEALSVRARCRSRAETLAPCQLLWLAPDGTEQQRWALEGLGAARAVTLPASSEPRYLAIHPDARRTAQVLVQDAAGLGLVHPERRWWQVRGAATVTVVAPTILQVRSEGKVEVDGRAVDGEAELVVDGQGPRTLSLRSDEGAWVRLAFRVPSALALPVVLPPTPDLETPQASASLQRGSAPVITRARPVQSPPLTLEVRGEGGVRRTPVLPGGGGAQGAGGLALLTRPTQARWFSRVDVQRDLGTAGPVDRARLDTVVVPWWGPRRLLLSARLDGRTGTATAGPLSSGTAQLGGRVGGWLGQRWLVQGDVVAFARDATGDAAGADPRLWTTYASDHRTGVRGALELRAVPARWWDARLVTNVVTNPAGTGEALDRVSTALRVDAAMRRRWASAEVGWQRGLPDLARDTPVDAVWVRARGWWATWVRGHTGVRWEVDGNVRLGPRTTWTVVTGPTLWWSRDRGLTDLPPTALAHRDAALWDWDHSATRALEAP